MRWLAAFIGFAIAILVLRDAFESTVYPRRTTGKYRLSRLFFRVLWLAWINLSVVIRSSSRRQHFLSIFGPLSLLALFAVWVAGLILSFAMFHWSLNTPLGTHRESPSFAACAYMSGETFFTLGYGDLTPISWFGRFLSVVESGLGFGFLAVIISYLPVLYQAFSQREQMIGLLDARAGSPPTAGELLRRLAQSRSLSQLDLLFPQWEHWSAALLEGNLSFPILAFYRSQHNNQSWLAGLAVILDTCAIQLAHFVDINCHQVQVTFAIARHAAVDLALIFSTRATHDPNERRIPAAKLDELFQLLATNGFEVDNSETAQKKFVELRAMYEPFLNALGRYFRFEVPPIIAEHVAADNWQRSPWLPRAPDIDSLPASHLDEHFS